MFQPVHFPLINSSLCIINKSQFTYTHANHTSTLLINSLLSDALPASWLYQPRPSPDMSPPSVIANVVINVWNIHSLKQTAEALETRVIIPHKKT